MREETPEYDSFVEHPRFGRSPRITGLNPKEDMANGIFLFVISPKDLIPGTAIEADTTKQKITAFPISFYFDQKRICRDCGRPFIWFAEEQKFWFEELGFNLGTDCIHCVHCRQRRKGRPAKATEDSRKSAGERKFMTG